MSAADSAAIRSRRVSVVTVKPGDTVATLSARMAYDDDRVARFTVLNGLATNSRLVSGARVKLIVWR